MNGNKKRFLKSIFCLAVLSAALAFSCFAFFDKSVAWFASNTDVGAEGMDIMVYSDNSVGVGSICVYKVDEDNNSATLYENPSAEELRNILTLNQYDSVFEEKREHTPIIVKTTLEDFSGGSEAATLTVTVSLKALTGYTMTNGSKTVLLPYISNFINVCCSVDPLLSDASMTPVEYYSHARDLFMSAPISLGAQRFVDYSGSGVSTSIGEKSDTLTFTLEKPAGQDALEVYLFLSYDENLIAKFINDNEQGVGSVGELEGYFEWGSEILFQKDIAKIVFAEAESE